MCKYKKNVLYNLTDTNKVTLNFQQDWKGTSCCYVTRDDLT